MRERFNDLFDGVEIKKLYDLSAIGMKLCIYAADIQAGCLLPKQNPSSLEFVTDTAPIDWWDTGILTPEARNGSDKLLVISRACALAFRVVVFESVFLLLEGVCYEIAFLFHS